MQVIIIRHLFSFIFSFLFAFYLVPLLAKSAEQLGFLDKPDGKIKVHKTPVPYLGGLAIYCCFIATLGLAYPFANNALWLLLGTTLLLLVGLIDDLKALRPGQKFFGQILAVLCFFKGGYSLKTEFFSSGFNLFISGFWMLSVINAFNLVDVMDGLASTIALVASISLFVIALIFGQYDASLLLAPFIGALLAFFLYNKPPASIYLGDSGSMFIGGFLSAMPFFLNWSSKSFDAYYAPAIILGIPLLEVFFLVIIRTSLGLRFYNGSPHHYCIYLQKKNWSKNKILLFTAAMGILLSNLAFLFLFQIISFWFLIALGAIFFALWCFAIFSHGKKTEQAHKQSAHVPGNRFQPAAMSAKNNRK
ncbi:MAG: MraY family glycosyltransferase [bacterium]